MIYCKMANEGKLFNNDSKNYVTFLVINIYKNLNILGCSVFNDVMMGTITLSSFLIIPVIA